MADAKSGFKIQKLNGSNYMAWKFEMKMLLINLNLWKYVNNAIPEEKNRTEEYLRKNDEALSTIALCCERSQHSIIRQYSFAREAWSALSKEHSQQTVMAKIDLLRQLFKMRYENNLDMRNYLADFCNILDECDEVKMEFPESLKASLILSSLNDSFDGAVSSLATMEENMLTVTLVRRKLIDEYNRRQARGEVDKDDRLMFSKHSKKMNNRPGEKKRLCWTCGSPDHIQYKCPKNKSVPPSANLAVSETQMVKSSDDVEDDVVTFMACSRTTDDGWYIDSGATCHMSHTRNMVSQINPGSQSKIYLADGSTIDKQGVGQAILKCENGNGNMEIVRIDNVLLVPGLKANLLSVSQLAKRGIKVYFDDNGAVVVKDGRTVAVADHIDGLYKLKTQDQAMMVRTNGHKKYCLHQWHRRFGHRQYEVVKQIVRDNGLKIENCGINETCECCLKSKMPRQPFPKKAKQWTTEKLQLVHSDLMGPVSPTSAGGKRYVMTMIDDKTRFTKIYLLNNKSDAPKMIESYVREMETKYNQKPQIIRSDRGGEYTGRALQAFYQKEGITAQYTVPYTPSQNGVAERKNRSLTEMVRCLLNDAALPRELWGEAIMTANFLQNRMPSNALPSGKTPFELWHGYAPDYDRLRVFGSSAWVQVPTEKRRKLDSTSKRMTFVGYSQEQKGYRFWDPEAQKTVVSRDSVFLELGNGSMQLSESMPQTMVPNDESLLNEHVDMDHTQEEISTDIYEVQEEITTDINEVQEEEVEPLRRSNRNNIGQIDPYLRENYILYNVKIIESEPRTYAEAMKRNDAIQWEQAMREEIESMHRNDAWELVDLPPNKNLVGCKWVFKLKTDTEGNPNRYRARLVAQGFSQKYGVDYDEVFAPTVQAATIRFLLSLAGERKYVVRHMDIKAAFLNGRLKEEIFMKQPPGFIDKTHSTKVCKLKRSLYGLKQAAHVWNERLTTVLQQLGYQKCAEDDCLFIRTTTNGSCFVLLHVDDILSLTPDLENALKLENGIASVFEITVLGDVKQFLGMKVQRMNDGSFSLSQTAYINKVIERFGMTDAKVSKIPMDPGYLNDDDDTKKLPNNEQYRSLVGALLYLSVCTRPDIATATSILARSVSEPTVRDWNEAKRVLRYLKGTSTLSLVLKSHVPNIEGDIVTYTDADFAGYRKDCKSNSGYVVFYNGAPIDWTCRKQDSVSLSSCESEYISLAETCQELLWIKRLIQEVLNKTISPPIVKEDNQSAIEMVKSKKIKRRSKHIDTKYHFVRDLYQKGQIIIQYCPTEDMIADMMTKPLNRIKLEKFRTQIGLAIPEEEC